MVGKYRKKPVEVEAIQFTGTTENYFEIEEWISDNWPDAKIDWESGRIRGEPKTLILKVPAANNNYDWELDQLDWLVKGVDGSLYPVKSDTFSKVYEVPTTDIKEESDTIVW